MEAETGKPENCVTCRGVTVLRRDLHSRGKPGGPDRARGCTFSRFRSTLFFTTRAVPALSRDLTFSLYPFVLVRPGAANTPIYGERICDQVRVDLIHVPSSFPFPKPFPHA